MLANEKMDFELLCIGLFALCGCVFFILFLTRFQGALQQEGQTDGDGKRIAEESVIMSSVDIDAGNLSLTSLACHSSNYFVKRLSRSLTAERSAFIMPSIVREFSFEQIEAATGKFLSSNIIKQGHSGDIYKGVLEEGEIVIIKRICTQRPTNKDVNGNFNGYSDQLILNKDSYIAEMDIYGKVLDQSFLVPMLGQCLSKEEKFLVYEYMPYGDLASILAKGRTCIHYNDNIKSSLSAGKSAENELLDAAAIQSEKEEEEEEEEDGIRIDIAKQGDNPFKVCRLAWPLRMKIAREVAQALVYLHHECRPPLSHRNIQSSSILLNKDLEVKLGSLGDAQKIESGEVPAYDIYCFGRLLLDLISGLDISGMKCTRDEEAQAWISKCFTVLITSISANIKDPNILELIDKDLLLQEHHLLEIIQVAKLAKLCMDPSTLQKLSMKRVLHLLPSSNSNSLLYMHKI